MHCLFRLLYFPLIVCEILFDGPQLDSRPFLPPPQVNFTFMAFFFFWPELGLSRSGCFLVQFGRRTVFTQRVERFSFTSFNPFCDRSAFRLQCAFAVLVIEPALFPSCQRTQFFRHSPMAQEGPHPKAVFFYERSPCQVCY